MKRLQFVLATAIVAVVTFPAVATAAPTGGVSGSVTAAVGGAGIAGIEVCAFASGGAPSAGPEGVLPCTTTEANGKYTIAGLSAGAYEIEFRSPADSGLDYVPQFYPEAASYLEVEPVMVNGTSIRTGIDAVLQVGARMSGRVEDAVSEAALSGVEVCAFSMNGGDGCAETGADGTYTIAGLTSGDYKVVFNPSDESHVFQYYDGAQSYESSKSVKVADGGAVSGIDARLAPGATVTGTVAGADNHGPVEGAVVCARLSSEEDRCDETDAAGSYSIEGLLAGEYELRVEPPEASGYADLYSARRFVLVAGQTTAGVDVELPTGGMITGTVTNAATEGPLAAVEVCAFGTTSGGSPEACAESGADGGYTIGHLTSGEYKVEFFSASESRYYDGAASFEGATAISVDAGSTTPGIDGRIYQGAEIAGVVTDAAGGAPIEGIEVCAFRTSNGYFGGCALTGSAGAYAISGLSEGEYRVTFESVSWEVESNFQRQYYSGTAEYSAATPVNVGPHERRGGIDAQMRKGGWIEGVVRSGATGEPTEGIEVCAEAQTAPYVSSCATTAAGGEYRVAGLPTGQYAVWFASQRFNLVDQYYEETGGGYPGQTVGVTAGVGASGIDTTLEAGGQITGRVTSEATGEPLDGVTVTASPQSGGGLSGTATTGADGRYMFRGLRAGEYTFEFNAHSSEFATQYYNERTDYEGPDPVTVAAGSRLRGIDAALTEPPPAEISPPSVSGTAREGETLTEVHGEWANSPTFYEYRWLRCNTSGFYCTYIDGARQQTYTLGEDDSGHTIEVEEFAANKGGESYSATSEPTAVVVPEPPVNIAPPGIWGTPQQGEELFEEPGEWRHEVSEFEYRWLRCDAEGNGCAPIAGAEAETYLPVAADVGHRLRVRETAINLGGAGQPAESEATAVVVPPVPTNLTPPTISGTAQQSHALTETNGAWTNEPDLFGHQWWRCDQNGEGCEPIAGADGVEYVPVGADVGHRLLVTETATNAGGASEPAESEPTAVVLPSPPVVISPPAISGTAQQGQPLVEEAGSWTNEPSSYEYRWLRCDAEGNGCAAIPGGAAAAAEYIPVRADVGHRLRVAETAINAGGPSLPAKSEATAVVVPPVPTNETPPRISGTAQQGRTLSEENGSWTNEPTSYEYRWLRCDAEGNGCAPIEGATTASYVPAGADIGQTLEVEETATNAGGTSEPAFSAPTSKVEPAAPVDTSPPGVIGQAQNGLTLIAQHGAWTNEPTSYAYRWLRCATASGCEAIAGAVDPTYRLRPADIGQMIEVEEVASNGAGPGAGATSAAVGPVTPIPLSVRAGENIETTVGAPVHFDGTGSGPAEEIDHYDWQFGDGAEADGVSQAHTYTSAGTYTVTLTVSRNAEHESASVTVTVVPVPGHQATVKVTDNSGDPLEGATVLYIGPGGERIEGAADGNGTAGLSGLPEGVDAVYVYKAGYQPAVGHVTVTAGGGETTVALESGALAASTLKSHEMTLSEIEAAGIDVNDPANQNVYEFEVRIAFLPDPAKDVSLQCYINEAGEFVGSCGGGGGLGGGGGGGWGGWGGGGGGGGGVPLCSPHACVGAGIVAIPAIINGHPSIQWLILRGRAAVLKQFFEVSEVVQNLSPQPFEFAAGTATLDIPSGMSLAPTATPQSATQGVAPIAGEGSAEINWIVRGDKAGLYPLAAEYHSTLEPLQVPVDLEARLATPLQVWGAAALELHVEAEEGALAEGRPYRVHVKVTNKANVPINNIGVEIFSDVHSQFIFQPGQKFSESIAELGPSETISAPMDILVPDAPSDYPFNPNLSSIHFVGEEIHPGEGVSTLSAAPVYSLVASDESASKRVRLKWQADPEAEGYEVYSTATLDTPFPQSPEQVKGASGGTTVTRLPADTTEAFVPYDSDDPDKYYAVTSIVNGTPTLDHLVALASTGSGADDWGYCFKADAGIALGIASADGTLCLVQSGDGSHAYLMNHGGADISVPPDLTDLKGSLESLAHSCAVEGSASVGAIAFEGPAGEDPGRRDYATVNGSVGVSIPLTDFGGGVEGALMQARDQSTFGLLYAYDASAGVGCLHLPFSVTASTEADYRFHPHELTGTEKDQALGILSDLRDTFTRACLDILRPESVVPACSLAAIPRIGKPAIDLVKHTFPSLYLSASGATTPPGPPAGISGWQQGSSNENTGFTTVSSGGISATGKGIGAVGIGTYDSEPQGLPALRVGSSYFDAKVSKDSIFGAVVISDCDIGDATSVQWWDSDANQWQSVSDARFSDVPPRCVEITVGQDTSPSLSQLTGTVFGAVSPTPACTASPTIERQPTNETVTAPAEATFSVAEGSIPADCSAASIQWQQSTDGDSGWSSVPGATAAVLKTGPTAVGESGRQFRAVLSNAHGSSTSAVATLTVGAEAAGNTPQTGPPAGGTSGGDGGAEPAVPTAAVAQSPSAAAEPAALACRKGFQRKKVKGRMRCVKKKKHHRRRRSHQG